MNLEIRANGLTSRDTEIVLEGVTLMDVTRLELVLDANEINQATITFEVSELVVEANVIEMLKGYVKEKKAS